MTQGTTKTVSGYAVAIHGMIVIPKGNMRAQAKLTTLMADVEEGKRPFSDLLDKVQDRTIRVQPVNRRFTEEEAEAMMAIAEGRDAPDDEDQEQTDKD